MSVRRLAAVLALCAIALPATGCFDPFAPRVLGRGLSTPPPTPNSPSGVLRLFEWAYNNRDVSEYRTVFTDDYRFAFSQLDTAGNRYRDQPWTRSDELESAKKLFDAASSITLQLDKSFAVFNDSRPGKQNGTIHKTVRTQVLLNIVTLDNNQINVQGKANFFLVRGDSAAIPTDLGVGPDPNRWYIERWEDETYAGALVAGPPAPLARLDRAGRVVPPAATAGGARPARAGEAIDGVTWGWVKVIYR
jgi:hypothetical protein